jgi:hypothetical protein
MTVTSTALFRGSATTNTATTLYTVESGMKAVVTNIAVTNTTANAGTFTIKLDGVAIASEATIAANDTVVIDLKQVLDSSKIIAGGASATTINIHISGVVIA